MKRKWIGCWTALLLALAAVAPSGAASPAYKDFERMGDYILEVGGEVHAGAEMYSSHSVRAILVVSSKLPTPVLLWPGNGSVDAVNLMGMAKRDNGHIDLLPNAVVGSYGSFELRDGTDVAFTAKGVEAVVKPKPALLGFQGLEGLTSHSPEYRVRADTYSPEDESLEALRGLSKEVRVQVYFGSWCPACGQMVPRIMKVAENLAGSKVKVEFYGLPREIGTDPRAKRYNVKSVPTGVVYVDGKEVGRITGNEWRSPEQALRAMVGS